ncbi:short-chain dehydrogenase [Pseudomonas sp. L-22-4S-12]|uniref:NnrS family protein n=1 Tax=Pseudomonas sp. L-22-4S-12 TaxID=2610893 RepID=UPI001326E89E|nr:NnrS family protein [Pseudomonas sp. L-22-4S-12]MWV16446.1 short-chain dehydrogenase [Pseudomonas sp. L-22-4S-12]
MQILDKRKAMAITPLLRLGFRPFFLLGSLLAALAIPLWLLALQGWPLTEQPLGGWLAWHRHELVFGFAGAIIAGFLLTAVQTWTGRPSLSGKPLAVLVAIWLVGRLMWWSGSPLLLLLSNLLFFAGVALVMARLLWAVRQSRNYPIVAVLLLLLGADLLTLLGVQQGNDGWQRQGTWAAVWLVAAMMGLIGGRVIPFFTQRGLGRMTAVQPWAWLDWALLLLTAALAVLHASGSALLAQAWLGLAFAALALGHGIRLLRWFDGGLLRVPLLWSLHLAYAWLGLACAGMALWHFGLLGNPSQALHALTVGGVGGLILAMLARVSLGHTGRPLELPRGFALAFVLLNLGGVFRVLGVGFWYLPSLWLAAICWTCAFALYLYCYAPMLWSTRADGHPG